MGAARYKPYPAYKPSYAAWSGDVPDHWSPIRLKHVFAEKKKVHNPALPAGSISFGNVIYKNKESLAKETKAAYQELRCGEFLINPLNMNYDLLSLRTALSSIDVVVSTGYMILQSVEGYDKNYLRWLLQQFDVAHMKTLGAGVRQTISYADIGNSFIFEPPLYEQTKIAAFLDYETGKIDALIAKQERLIELLEEKRQAVISHAVTKGLNPNAPLRPSGIDWLGNVPEHWTCIQLGKLCRKVADGPHFSPNYVDEGVPFLSARNIKVDKWSLSDVKYISEKDCSEFDQRIVPELGDVLYTKGGTTGVARVVDFAERFQVWVHIAVLKINSDIVDSYYLAFALNSAGCYEQSQLHTRGATNNDLGLTRMIKIILAMPDLAEQKVIVDHLNRQTAHFDQLISKAQSAIALLKERRTALISAAVTGKIDLRDWQPPEGGAAVSTSDISPKDFDQVQEAIA